MIGSNLYWTAYDDWIAEGDYDFFCWAGGVLTRDAYYDPSGGYTNIFTGCEVISCNSASKCSLGIRQFSISFYSKVFS